MQRLYSSLITQDLANKMVFVGGPRQVGKTTLCNMIAESSYGSKGSQYLNWDNDDDRKIIMDTSWRKDISLVIFDELHKFPRWKQWLKGIYDNKQTLQQYLVTGSARLDTYKKGGDSLLGRYHYWRLHPLSIDELPDGINPDEGFERLITFGGFPEPFLKADERESRRWRRERFDRIIREDIRDLSEIRNIQLLQLFVDALRSRAGQLVVLSNLAEDLQISPVTAKHWLQLIQELYVCFAVYPLTKNVPRSIQKPPKCYFYDNADTTNDHAARLENMVATTLLKRLHFLEDYYGHRCQLHYIRDKNGREVDFATIIDGKLEELIEVKTSDMSISSSLTYYNHMLKPKRAVQIVGTCNKTQDKNGIIISSPIEYFTKVSPFKKPEDS